LVDCCYYEVAAEGEHDWIVEVVEREWRGRLSKLSFTMSVPLM
jgi:hypothetical protein